MLDAVNFGRDDLSLAKHDVPAGVIPVIVRVHHVSNGLIGHALDLSALITTGTTDSGNIQFQSGNFSGDAATDTRVLVDFDGQSGVFDSSFSPSLQIDLESIDLFAAHGAGNNNDLIADLIANGNLIV